MTDKDISCNVYDDGLLFWTDSGKEYMLLVDADDVQDDPRKEGDPVTRLYCRHPRSALGDYPRDMDPEDFLARLVEDAVPAGVIAARSGVPAEDFLDSVRDGTAGMDEIMETLDGHAVLEPVWCYEHSGMSISAGSRTYPFNDRFDSGQLGWIAVLRRDVEDEWPDEADWKARAEALIQADIELYGQWIDGDIHWYRLSERTAPDGSVQDDGSYSDEDWDEIDSCGGFYGTDIVKNGMLESVGHGLESALLESRAATGARKSRTVTVYRYERD